MQTRIRTLMIWGLSLAAAFALGYQTKKTPKPDRERERTVTTAPKRNTAPSDEEIEERVVRYRQAAVKLDQEQRKARMQKTAAKGHLPERSGPVHDASTQLMSLAEDAFKRGPQGHIELLLALDKTMRELQESGAREEEIMPEVYPWIRFLVAHETDMVDMTDTLMRTIAEDPGALDGINNDSLAFFMDSLGAMLPGAIPESRLAEFRDRAEEIVNIPEESRTELQENATTYASRALERYWQKPVSREEALAELTHGTPDLAHIDRYLHHLDEIEVASIDLERLLGDQVDSGEPEALRLLSTVHLDERSREAFDRRILHAEEAGVLNGYAVFDYLQQSGRTSWSEVQSFFEAGLNNDAFASSYVQFLLMLDPENGPPEEYLAQLLERPGLEDHDRDQIRQRLQGIE